MVLRQTTEELVQRKNLIVAAVHANPNWDGEENQAAREQHLNNIEDSFNRTIEYLYDPGKLEKEKKAQEAAMKTPFWDAARRGMERQQARIRGYEDGTADMTVDEAMKRELKADQGQDRTVKRSYDQI